MSLPASDWNGRMKEVTEAIASKIPYVGAVAKFLIGLLWPENTVDIFQLMKDAITDLVRKEILMKELELSQSQIDGLRAIIQRYEDAKTHEKRGFLTSWIVEADKLSIVFRQSSNNIHLILPTVTMALLHLTALRERLEHGMELYEEDNRERWKADLEEMYRTYIVEYFPTIFKCWESWRSSEVKIEQGVGTHPTAVPPFFMFYAWASVEDKVTGERKDFRKEMYDSKTYFEVICNDHKTRMCNQAIAETVSHLSTSFDFYKILPDNWENFPAYDKEVFSQIFLGPYSQVLLDNSNANDGRGVRLTNNDYSSDSGPLSKMIIREWNSIDALRFIYANRQGTLVGNPNGGEQHELVVTGDKTVTGLRMGFYLNILAYLQILYSDGTKSNTYGNRSDWPNSEGVANGPADGYRLRSWSYGVAKGPSGIGPAMIRWQFEPTKPSVPPRKISNSG